MSRFSKYSAKHRDDADIIFHSPKKMMPFAKNFDENSCALPVFQRTKTTIIFEDDESSCLNNSSKRLYLDGIDDQSTRCGMSVEQSMRSNHSKPHLQAQNDVKEYRQVSTKLNEIFDCKYMPMSIPHREKERQGIRDFVKR